MTPNDNFDISNLNDLSSILSKMAADTTARLVRNKTNKKYEVLSKTNLKKVKGIEQVGIHTIVDKMSDLFRTTEEISPQKKKELLDNLKAIIESRKAHHKESSSFWNWFSGKSGRTEKAEAYWLHHMQEFVEEPLSTQKTQTTQSKSVKPTPIKVKYSETERAEKKYQIAHACDKLVQKGTSKNGEALSESEIQKLLKEAFDMYQQAADAGNANAQFELGKIFELGTHGQKSDIHKAVEWYTKAASLDVFEIQPTPQGQSCVKARIKLAEIYFSNNQYSSEVEYPRYDDRDTPDRANQIRSWLSYAMNATEDADAQALYALTNVKRDDGIRKKYQISAMEKQSPWAYYCRGQINSLNNRHLDAAKDFMTAATMGLSAAQYRLSEYYRTGEGVEKNDEMAKIFLLRAAKQNNKLASLELSNKYPGLQPDEINKLNAKNLVFSAENQYIFAQYLFNNKKYPEALKLFEKLTKNKDLDKESQADVHYHLGLIYHEKLVSNEKSMEDIRTLFETAADLDKTHAKAQFELGKIAESEITSMPTFIDPKTGVLALTTKEKEAIEWYTKAANQVPGLASAKSKLAILYYLKGDVEKAVKLAKDASDVKDPDGMGIYGRILLGKNKGSPTKEIKKLFNESALKNSAIGFIGLGLINTQIKEYYEYSLKAANLDSAWGNYNLSACYSKGLKFTPVNQEEEIKYLLVADAKGFPRARERLIELNHPIALIRQSQMYEELEMKKEADSFEERATNAGYKPPEVSSPKPPEKPVVQPQKAAEVPTVYPQFAPTATAQSEYELIAPVQAVSISAAASNASKPAETSTFLSELVNAIKLYNNKAYAEAFEEFRQIARTESDSKIKGEALFYMAKIVQNKQITKYNKTEKQLFEEAANLNYTLAQFEMGKMAEKEITSISPKDKLTIKEKEAIDWYTKAANNNLASAQAKLANIYFYKGDLEKANEMATKAVANDPDGLDGLDILASILSVLKRQGAHELTNRSALAGGFQAKLLKTNLLWNKGKHSEAFKGYEELAKLGFAEAQYEISYCYKTGKGTTQIDLVKEKEWLLKADAQANPKARTRLLELKEPSAQFKQGQMLEEIGDKAEAEEFYKLAADQNYLQAKVRLGWIYLTSKDPVKIEKAKVIIKDLLDLENTDIVLDIHAKALLGLAYGWSLNVKLDPEKAFIYFQDIVNSSSKDLIKDAILKLDLPPPNNFELNIENFVEGRYKDGLYIDKYTDYAVKWHEKKQMEDISDADKAFAFYSLGVMHENGYGGLDKDFDLAVMNYISAADAGDPRAQYELAMKSIPREFPNEELDQQEWRKEATQLYEQKIYWLTKAAEQTHKPGNKVREAQYELANLYLNQPLPPEVPSKEIQQKIKEINIRGEQLLQQAAKNGYIPAQTDLGIRLLSKKEEEGVTWLTKVARIESDNPKAKLAQFTLANIFKDGTHGVSKNYEDASILFELSNSAEFPANLDLGIIFYEGGHGLMADKKMAFQYFTKARNSEFTKNTAELYLARMYIDGEGVDKIPEEALKEALEILNQMDTNNPEVIYELGRIYEKKGNLKKAVELYRQAFNLGNISAAAFQIAGIYEKGNTFGDIENTSIDFYQKAADRGNAKAQYKIAQDYRLKNNKPEMMKWLQKGAENGHRESQYQLGLLLGKKDEDFIIEQNTLEANTWMIKAATQGHTKAKLYLYKNSKLAHLEKATAIKFLKEAAENNPEAQLILGKMYRNNQEYKEAVTQFEKVLQSAKKKNKKNIKIIAEAECQLGNLYLDGLGVVRDKSKAIKLFESAEKRGNEEAKNKLLELE
ncbi:MAG: SEL1-like repeat protein [Parachlamydiaceae bacterium]|nr:SEL1-like repeat protein [Parachlamydiaceae bacterium]